jgi:hypothetical protein
MSLMEAMGAGLVPVVSDLQSGIRQVTSSENSIRVSPDDINGYSSAIVWLHSHREAMEQMSRNAYETIRANFSVEVMAERWIAALSHTESAPVAWPNSWRIRPVIGIRHPSSFLPCFRPLRRLALRLKRRFASR